MVRRRVAAAFVLAFVTACQPAGVTAPTASPPASPTATAASTASASVAASPSATARAPQTVTCGQVVTVDIVVANDLACRTDGLVAGADGITIDLGGHTFSGPGMGPQTWPAPQLDSVGVRVEGRRNVTIRNGKTSDFSTGVYFRATVGSVIEGIDTERNRYGFYLYESNGNAVRGNTVAVNIYGIHVQTGTDNLIQGNQLVRQTYNSPGGFGIYLFQGKRNRIVDNDIANNVNWGIWFSESTGNLTFHNNVYGNRPQVSDNTQGNTWYDAERKEGNYWGDYPGKDNDGDGIGDSSYLILGPADVVDPYPFIEKDGWKRKRSETIDHWLGPVARPPKDVHLVVRTVDGEVWTARPGDPSAATRTLGTSSIALGTDGHTLYALTNRDGQSDLLVQDLATGEDRGRAHFAVAGIVAANRDGRSALVVGPAGAEQRDLEAGAQAFFAYRGQARALAPSYKHNHIFVSTPRGIDLLYLNLGGRTPYTIPLDGPAGAMAMNGSGTRIYVAIEGRSVIDVVELEQYMVVSRIAIELPATAVAVSPREDRLYAATGHGLLSIDLASGTTSRRAEFLGDVVDLAVSPNGDQLYAALVVDEGLVAVLSTADLSTANVIRLPSGPAQLLVASY